MQANGLTPASHHETCSPAGARRPATTRRRRDLRLGDGDALLLLQGGGGGDGVFRSRGDAHQKIAGAPGFDRLKTVLAQHRLLLVPLHAALEHQMDLAGGHVADAGRAHSKDVGRRGHRRARTQPVQVPVDGVSGCAEVDHLERIGQGGARPPVAGRDPLDIVMHGIDHAGSGADRHQSVAFLEHDVLALVA
jgi:hypothetical protein